MSWSVPTNSVSSPNYFLSLTASANLVLYQFLTSKMIFFIPAQIFPPVIVLCVFFLVSHVSKSEDAASELSVL